MSPDNNRRNIPIYIKVIGAAVLMLIIIATFVLLFLASVSVGGGGLP